MSELTRIADEARRGLSRQPRRGFSGQQDIDVVENADSFIIVNQPMGTMNVYVGSMFRRQFKVHKLFEGITYIDTEVSPQIAGCLSEYYCKEIVNFDIPYEVPEFSTMIYFTDEQYAVFSIEIRDTEGTRDTVLVVKKE